MTSALAAFRNDGLTFDLTDTGPSDGPVVVLLHGFPQNRHCWQAIAKQLNDAGYRTLAPDLRGYSPQASPKDPSAYRLSVQVGDVLALAQAAGADQFHVVGHDWGGALAWTVAAAHPARVQTLTSLSTPHPRALAQAMRSGDQARRSSYMLGFQVPWVSERLMVRARQRMARGISDAAYARYLAQRDTPASWTGPLNWYRGNSPFTHRSDTPACAVNSTLVWGSRDPYLGRDAATATADWVKADHRLVELDAGHWLPERNPDPCAQAILHRLSTGL